MNMSYCRFRNTLQDFRDCMDAIEMMNENPFDEESNLSHEEEAAMYDLYQAAMEFVQAYDIDDLENFVQNIKELNK